MIDGPIQEGLTFDDVLLVPGRSSVLPAEVETQTNFTRKLKINVPLVSAAMDTVTESRLAIAMARQGGIGLIHRNMPVDRQAEEVDRVQRSWTGLISIKYMQKELVFPRSSKDSQARLMTGAAVCATGDFLERAVEMSKAKAEVLAIDTAHGHTAKVMEAIKTIRQRLPEMQSV